MSQTNSKLDELQCIVRDAATLTLDQIRERMARLVVGMRIINPVLDPGAFVYRARKIDDAFNFSKPMRIADLIYPPAETVRLNRANREGRPMFYCAAGKEPLFFELGELAAGDELALTSWQTKAKMIVNNIGYTKFVFDQLGAKRPCPEWKTPQPTSGTSTIEIPRADDEFLRNKLPGEADDQLRFELGKLFMNKDSNLNNYKLTAAIAEAHLGEISPFAGVLYPSVRMWANGDNLALKPEFVDRNLTLKRATRVRIDDRTATTINVSYHDCARKFDADGRLNWLGRPLCWTIAPGQTIRRIQLPGRDSDGEYSIGKDGNAVFWEARDAVTGALIEMN